ncbi:MAG: hypothetical protein RAK22_02850 [Nanoarchaeota archaeon]|nr:hypothetical protein [Nanoarchaeota archaeon]
MKAEHKFEVSEKKWVDTAYAVALLILGSVMLAWGFTQVLYKAVPSLPVYGSGIIIGAIVFFLGLYIYKYHV